MRRAARAGRVQEDTGVQEKYENIKIRSRMKHCVAKEEDSAGHAQSVEDEHEWHLPKHRTNHLSHTKTYSHPGDHNSKHSRRHRCAQNDRCEVVVKDLGKAI